MKKGERRIRPQIQITDKMSSEKLSHKNMVAWFPSLTYLVQNYSNYISGLCDNLSRQNRSSGKNSLNSLYCKPVGVQRSFPRGCS